jgi:hypothetical protein
MAPDRFHDATRMRAPAMGEFATPIDISASISILTLPTASLTHASAVASVTRSLLT